PRTPRADWVCPRTLYDADVAALLPSSKPPAANAPTPPTSIAVDNRLFDLVSEPLEALTHSSWTNLSSFSAHGGKLMFYHGMSDPTFAAMDTLEYYKKMSAANGG